MTTQHARPLVAYLCVALVAALLLAQGLTVPRDVPGVSGVIGGVGSLDLDLALGAEVVLTPLQGRDDVAAVGTAVPRRVTAQRSVVRATGPSPAARPRAATAVHPRATGVAQTVRPGTHRPKAPQATGVTPRAVRPGNGRALAKGHGRTSPARGHARASLRSSPRDVGGPQRAGQRAKGHGRARR